jgi:hypothetical protein
MPLVDCGVTCFVPPEATINECATCEQDRQNNSEFACDLIEAG